MLPTLLARASYIAMPVLVLGAIWFSVVDHYYVSTPTITDEMLEQARQAPPG